MSTPLRFRQIHLDFHTSPAIPGIGADFDPDEFAATLEAARVNSITCFARCHHGHLYFESQVHPERVHPNLARRNLLGEQIEACHRRGIRVPVYITVQWDRYTADRHRDWLCLDDEGREAGTRPLDAGFYRTLDVFHPEYRQFLYEHVREVLTSFEIDGLFFDIVQAAPSLAMHWIEAMDAAGVDPTDRDARQTFAIGVIQDWEREMTSFVREFDADCTIFYNSGHVGPRHRTSRTAYTHYELESLPSGGWGYLHFPQSMRYARNLGKECLGMTGKFHTTWGDFGSYKNPAALQFECFQMLALGAKCSVGDQLHPSGKIDPVTYDLVGSVYREVERKEPWCEGATPVCDVAVLTTEAFVTRQKGFHARSERDQPGVDGALRMLHELQVQFDLVDDTMDFSPYRVLVLPDTVPFDDALAAKVRAFLAGGGKALASHRSVENAEFLGVRVVGDAPYSPDFLVPGEAIGADLPKTGHVMYLRALELEPAADARVLAWTETPYFNRNWRHYCSHQHTPSSGQAGYPAVVEQGGAICFAHPVFTQYRQNAPRWVKHLVADALRRLLPDPVLEIEGPTTLLSALSVQKERGRHVLHLLHYVPERRGQAFDILEDVLPVYGIGVRLRLPGAVASVRLVPDDEALAFAQADGLVSFTVPAVHGHAMIEIA